LDHEVGESVKSGRFSLLEFLVDHHIDLLLVGGSQFLSIHCLDSSLGLLGLLILHVSVTLTLPSVVDLQLARENISESLELFHEF